MLKPIVWSSLIAVSLSACMQQSAPSAPAPTEAAEPAKTVQLAPAIQTKKPAPAITFSHQDPAEIAVGDAGLVTITVNEGYPFGTLQLEAAGSEGLDVFGATATTSLDMADITTHTWQVNYAASEDGVYSIFVTATAAVEDGVTESRPYSVEVKVGNWQNAQSKTQQRAATQTLSDGSTVVILEAEEIIE